MTEVMVHGKQFQIVNKGKKQWQTEYRNAIATKSDSKAEALRLLKEYDRDKLLSACDSHDKTVQRDMYFKEHTEEFAVIFGFQPPRDFLMYALGCGLCLDVIALDNKLHTPDGISTNYYITQQYGSHATELVKNMI